MKSTIWVGQRPSLSHLIGYPEAVASAQDFAPYGCTDDSVSSTRPREEWVAYSFERFVAAIKTRYTPHPDDMYSPTRQPAKRCREQSLWRQPTAEVERAACAEIDMARRPSSRTMPLARRREPAARWRAPRLGAAEVRRLHHSRTTPAPLPLGVVQLIGLSFATCSTTLNSV